MATITNNTNRPITLPTKIVIQRGATIEVENGDITNRDNGPTIASSVANGDLSYALDPEDPEEIAAPVAVEPVAQAAPIITETSPAKAAK
jgi:hypothetical protein